MSNKRVISEWCNGKYLEGSGCGIFKGTTQKLSWRDWGKTRKASARPASLWVKIWTWDFLNTKQDIKFQVMPVMVYTKDNLNFANFWLQSSEGPGSNAWASNHTPRLRILMYFSIPASKCWDITLKQHMTASFHIYPNSSLTVSLLFGISYIFSWQSTVKLTTKQTKSRIVTSKNRIKNHMSCLTNITDVSISFTVTFIFM
jgi:hypothetical protein